MKHVLGGPKTSISLYLPARNLKVYTKALTRLSHVFHPNSLNDTYSLKVTLIVEMVDRTYFPRMGKGQGASDFLDPI